MKERYYFIISNNKIRLYISSNIKEDIFSIFKYYGWEDDITEEEILDNNTFQILDLLSNNIGLEEYILLYGHETPKLTKHLIECFREKINFSFMEKKQHTKFIHENKSVIDIRTLEIIYNFKFKKFQQKRNNYRKEESNG